MTTKTLVTTSKNLVATSKKLVEYTPTKYLLGSITNPCLFVTMSISCRDHCFVPDKELSIGSIKEILAQDDLLYNVTLTTAQLKYIVEKMGVNASGDNFPQLSGAVPINTRLVRMWYSSPRGRGGGFTAVTDRLT